MGSQEPPVEWPPWRLSLQSTLWNYGSKATAENRSFHAKASADKQLMARQSENCASLVAIRDEAVNK